MRVVSQASQFKNKAESSLHSFSSHHAGFSLFRSGDLGTVADPLAIKLFRKNIPSKVIKSAAANFKFKT